MAICALRGGTSKALHQELFIATGNQQHNVNGIASAQRWRETMIDAQQPAGKNLELTYLKKANACAGSGGVFD